VNRRIERGLFWIAVVALLCAHMLGFGQAGRPLVLGWLPIDLAYRIAWMGMAAVVVMWMTTRLWPEAD
jgi:hypothetical protein